MYICIMKSGIYIFINKVNQKCYIGSAVDLNKRRLDHLCLLRQNNHHSRHFQRSFNKHKENNFLWFILERVEKSDLIKKEQYYMDILNPEYNICKIANSSLGVKRSKETCDKIGKAKMGNTNWLGIIKSKSHRENISNGLKGNTNKKGKKCSEIARQNIAKGNIGKINRLGTSKYPAVIQLSLNNEELNTFDDVYKAGLTIGLSRQQSCKIIRACKLNYVAYGYKWKFKTKLN